MVNRWIEHVKKYAKKHNIAYGCAISKAGATYKKTVKKTKKTKKNDDIKTGIEIGLYEITNQKNKWRIITYLKPEKRNERRDGKTAYISHHTGTREKVEKIAKKELKKKYKQIQKEFNIVPYNKLNITIKNKTAPNVSGQVSLGKREKFDMN